MEFNRVIDSHPENILKKALKSAGIKINKPAVEIPELLLSYTYFLNSSHSSHLTIGYNNKDFTLRIIVFKNNIFHTLRQADWAVLIKNVEIIENHFNNKYETDFAELPNENAFTQFKLSIRRGEKCLISVQNNKKLILETPEWQKLYQWLPYINTVAIWYNSVTLEIQKYYDRYLHYCIQNRVMHLLPHHFFRAVDHSQYFYNNSRIFNEIPIICKNKLRDDIIEYYDKIDS